MEERIATVPDTEGLYEVNNQGVIKNIVTGHIIKPAVNYKGYCVVSLKYGSGYRSKLVHRIVWESFNGEIPSGLQINHVNEDKTDNRLENLELVTPSQNVQHSIERVKPGMSNVPRPVIAIDASGNFAMYFDSKKKAGERFGARTGANIEAAIKVNGTAYGYSWRYFDTLTPVQKLAVVAFDDIKNKAKSDAQQIPAHTQQ